MVTHKLLLDMDAARFEALYDALPDEVSGALDVPVAKMLNSRLETARRRPKPMKLRALRAFLSRQRDDELAMEMLRGYLLGPRKALVTGFLDGTGIKHEDGQVEDDDAEPDEKKVPGAIKSLMDAHDPEDVKLYVRVAAMQWPESEALQKEVAGLEPAS